MRAHGNTIKDNNTSLKYVFTCQNAFIVHLTGIKQSQAAVEYTVHEWQAVIQLLLSQYRTVNMNILNLEDLA